MSIEERIKKYMMEQNISEEQVIEYIMEDPTDDYILYEYFCKELGVGN